MSVKKTDDTNWPLVAYVQGIAENVKAMFGYDFMHIGSTPEFEEFVFLKQLGNEMHFKAFAIHKNDELDEGRKAGILQLVMQTERSFGEYLQEKMNEHALGLGGSTQAFLRSS